MTAEPLPLAGITVVAVEQAVAAPLATRHLADLGARLSDVGESAGGVPAVASEVAALGGRLDALGPLREELIEASEDLPVSFHSYIHGRRELAGGEAVEPGRVVV